jgi:hypothetical protein
MAYVILKDRNPKYDWSGPLANRPVTAVEGSTYYDETNSILYLYASTGWIVHPDHNQIAKVASHSFIFDEDDLTKTAAIAYNGLVKNLHLVVPAFTNVVTATVTLIDASSRVLWTSAAKAKGASYNLEAPTETEWVDQLVDNTLTWKITLSGVAGGTGGTVVLIPRYYGV